MHNHSKENKNVSGKNILIVIILNLIITISEIIAGILSGSLSIISDAMHNLSDVFAIFISYIAILISKKEKNYKNTFGYKRVEILTATINSVFLIIVSVFLFKEAFIRLQNPIVINTNIIMIVATIALIGNLISVVILNRGSKESINIKSAYLHLIMDTLSSVAVILGGILINIFKIYWIDSVLTIIIGIYILFISIKLLKQIVNVLMQSTPVNIKITDVIIELKKIDFIKDVHHIHVWSLDGEETYLEAHVNVSDIKVSETKPILEEIEHVLMNHFDIHHVTIQFESTICDNKVCK